MNVHIHPEISRRRVVRKYPKRERTLENCMCAYASRPLRELVHGHDGQARFSRCPVSVVHVLRLRVNNIHRENIVQRIIGSTRYFNESGSA